MDTRGFPDFKLHLAQSLANGTPYVNRNVNEDDSVESYTGKIFESAMATLDHVRHSLDKSAINRAVDLLTQAKKIAFFGLGSSAAVAHDAMNKFFRFNVPVVYSDDIVLQRMSCMNCSDGDVVVPMVSRLAQLTVIDVLATGFTLRRGAKFRDNLKRVKEALKESRFDKQLLNLSDDR